MAYSLFKKITNRPTERIPIDLNVRDFCCVDEDLFIIHDNGIALMNDGELYMDWIRNVAFSEMPDLTTLSSICYNDHHKCLYIVGDGGCRIYSICLQLMNCEPVFSQEDVDIMKKKYVGCKDSETHITSVKDKIVWSIKDAHRCFQVISQRPEPLVGCGRSGFSLSTPVNSKICHPTGVTIMENIFCYSDCGNEYLRGVQRDSSFVIIGDCKDLGSVHYFNKRLYILSDNIIHMLSPEGNTEHLFEVYKGKEIKTFCPSSKNCICILEKNNGGTKKDECDQPT
jgi:hypothetical protein